MFRNPPDLLIVGILLLAVIGKSSAQEPAADQPPSIASSFSEGYRIVFISVLEGCFQDGLSDQDVDQILRNPKPDEDWYEHFIQNCPICMATIKALQTYRSRPDAHLKRPGKVTFGDGLSKDLRQRLYGTDIKERLSAIHDLEESWVQRHLSSLRLDAQEIAKAQEALKKARQEGIDIMQMFAGTPAFTHVAPGYHEGDECAVCNAANGMALKVAPAR